MRITVVRVLTTRFAEQYESTCAPAETISKLTARGWKALPGRWLHPLFTHPNARNRLFAIVLLRSADVGQDCVEIDDVELIARVADTAYVLA